MIPRDRTARAHRQRLGVEVFEVSKKHQQRVEVVSPDGGSRWTSEEGAARMVHEGRAEWDGDGRVTLREVFAIRHAMSRGSNDAQKAGRHDHWKARVATVQWERTRGSGKR